MIPSPVYGLAHISCPRCRRRFWGLFGSPPEDCGSYRRYVRHWRSEHMSSEGEAAR